MPNVSFASGGDEVSYIMFFNNFKLSNFTLLHVWLNVHLQETQDFVAYVAKDSKYGRACFVLDCSTGSAQEVIKAIGQAFDLRFKEFLKRSPKNDARYTHFENT